MGFFLILILKSNRYDCNIKCDLKNDLTPLRHDSRTFLHPVQLTLGIFSHSNLIDIGHFFLTQPSLKLDIFPQSKPWLFEKDSSPVCDMYHHLSSVKFERGSWGPSINYVISVEEEGVRPKDDLLHRPYLIKKRGKGSKIADFETT